MDAVFTNAQFISQRRHAINIFIYFFNFFATHTLARAHASCGVAFSNLHWTYALQTRGDWGLCSRSRTTFQGATLREKLKFDVNQAVWELDVTGAFYSTYPSLFPFGISAELQLQVAPFSPIKWNLSIIHFTF